MLSNKSLALILVVSILISAGGTFTALLKLDQLRGSQVITGRATTGAQGQANVTVSAQIALTAIGSFIQFGGGFANGSTCRLNSTPSGLSLGNCTTFRDANESLVVRNDGNSNLTINLSFDKTNLTWIGGTNPGVWFQAIDNESSSCVNGTRYYGTSNWTPLPATASQSTRICQGDATRGRMAFDDTKDQINIDITVLIPADAPSDPVAGDNLTITITGSDSDSDITA